MTQLNWPGITRYKLEDKNFHLISYYVWHTSQTINWHTSQTLFWNFDLMNIESLIMTHFTSMYILINIWYIKQSNVQFKKSLMWVDRGHLYLHNSIFMMTIKFERQSNEERRFKMHARRTCSGTRTLKWNGPPSFHSKWGF